MANFLSVFRFWHYGVLDLSNPAARRMMVGRIAGFVRRYDADGTYVCPRTHSSPAGHADQYGFGPGTVEAYRRRYGIDITRDKRFDWRSSAFAPDSAEVANWRRLRGEFLIAFYRELRAALPGKLVYLGLPRGDYLGAPYGNLPVDVGRIVRERLADAIVPNLYSGRGLYPQDGVPHAKLTTGRRLTVDGWFKVAASQCSEAPRLVCKYAHDLDAERGWEVMLVKGRARFHARIESPGRAAEEITVESAQPLSRDRWVRLTVNFDGPAGRVTIAADGKVVAATSFQKGSRLFDNRSVPILIGCYGNGAQKADMAVDDLTLSGDGRPLLSLECEGAERLATVRAPGMAVDVRGTPEFVPGPHGKALSLLDDR